MIPALVLTAGLATRLQPLSFVRAKAALPVGGETIVSRILRHLRAAGVTEAVLNLHHYPETIASRIGDGAEIGLKVRYSWESPVVLGAAGGVRKAIDLVDTPTLLVVNGDTFIDLDIAALVQRHKDSGALVTLAVVPNTRPDHYSGVRADSNGRFTGIVPRGSTEPSWHLVGFQVIETRIYASLASGVPVASVWPLYHALTGHDPDAVRVHACDLPFLDVGTPEDYFAASHVLADGRSDVLEQGRNARVHSTAVVKQSILWDDVTIEAGARLDRTIVTDGVRVPANTRWQQVILRNPTGTLAPMEQLIGELAVSPIAVEPA